MSRTRLKSAILTYILSGVRKGSRPYSVALLSASLCDHSADMSVMQTTLSQSVALQPADPQAAVSQPTLSQPDPLVAVLQPTASQSTSLPATVSQPAAPQAVAPQATLQPAVAQQSAARGHGHNRRCDWGDLEAEMYGYLPAWKSCVNRKASIQFRRSVEQAIRSRFFSNPKNTVVNLADVSHTHLPFGEDTDVARRLSKTGPRITDLTTAARALVAIATTTVAST